MNDQPIYSKYDDDDGSLYIVVGMLVMFLDVLECGFEDDEGEIGVETVFVNIVENYQIRIQGSSHDNSLTTLLHAMSTP